ncbi:MAG: ABC transporter permease, partial [Gemmatimonadota bacterium]|nr:ABC transporter permease [Gemmatimonadota bacterium]
EFSASNPASATLRVDSIDSAALARVRALPPIEDAEARRTVIGSARIEGGWRTATLFAADDLAGKRIGVLKRERGDWPPPDGSIAIEASSVEFSGASIGKPIAIQIGDGPLVDLNVAGVGRDVGLAPGWMEHVVYGFVTPRTLARLGQPASLNELQIVVRDSGLNREGVRRVANSVSAVLAGMGHRVSSIDVPTPGRHIHAAQIDSLLYTQGAFGFLALLLSGVLVINLISAMLVGQVREIGIMKALGARAEQIAAMYLALALLLGVVACAISLPVAAVLGRAYAQFTADMLNFDISGFAIPGWSFGLQLAVGILLPLAAAAVPVTRGSRIGVGEALRDFGIPGRGDGGAPRLLRHVGGVTRPLLLSLRNAFRRRQRTVLTLVTLSLGGAIYIGALDLRRAIIGSVDLLFDAQRYDLSMQMARSYPVDSLQAGAREVEGVARVEAWTGARAAIASTDGPAGNSFPITAPPVETKMLALMLLRGRGVRVGDVNALVVNRRLLDENPQLEVGSRVPLIVGGRSGIWTVVGVAETGPSPAAYTTRETLSGVTGAGASGLVVATSLRGEASQLDLIRRLRSDLTDRGFDVRAGQLKTQQRRVVEDHLLMVAGFLGWMAQLVIVVGGLGLASTMGLAVLERTREIGVLRAIGARHRSVFTMVQIEGLVIAFLSWLLAIPLSIPMSVGLGKAFGRIMITVPVDLAPDLEAVWRWLAVSVIVSVVACAWPALRAMRVPTAAALAYE